MTLRVHCLPKGSAMVRQPCVREPHAPCQQQTTEHAAELWPAIVSQVGEELLDSGRVA